MSVKVENLTKIYQTQRAIDDVSFEVKKGEILGFLGPNGAGKTTTMKILTGFIPQTSGKATVCGFDVATQPLEVRREIGYLPEHNPLYKDMYVREYLMFVAGLHRVSNKKQRVAMMIEQTGLGQEQHKLIGALSKGYKQRVGLAQAMLHDPKVLILDEPTTGLDPNQIVEIRQLIKTLGQEKTVIFSTHIMQEVQAICDRAMIINHGKIVANDTIEQLKSRFSGENIVTVQFAATTMVETQFIASLSKIKGVRRVAALGENRYQIIASDAKTDLQTDIFQFAVTQQLTIVELKKEVSSVETVFQKLTNE
jgi:ABC-2 type transport system ATP-binding protein